MPACYYKQMPPAELQSGVWTAAGATYGPLRTTGPHLTTPAPAEPGLPAIYMTMGVQPYLYVCGASEVVAWVPIASPAAARPKTQAPPAAPPLKVALQQLEAEITGPGLTINASPAGAGITNLPSYFWISGYAGQPLYQPSTTTAPGGAGTLELRLIPEFYVWNFGDGSSLATHDLGHAYPTPSDIARTYQVRSDWSPDANAEGDYAVSVTAYFDIAYQVDLPGQSPIRNGTWTDFSTVGLGPLADAASVSYRVIEVVSALVG